ncbi:MAG TPA: hypothetical protein VMS64_23785 [Candidatus Methylomirabilis sp.]|nr:hypothetical protein [Candidatus Methylomirabilis sp.]
MKLVGTIVGVVALVAGAGHVSPVRAQETPKPDINMTLTETINRMPPGPSTRDDIREIPPPKSDKLSDTARVTVVVGDNCLPGDDMGIPRSFRRPTRTR